MYADKVFFIKMTVADIKQPLGLKYSRAVWRLKYYFLCYFYINWNQEYKMVKIHLKV